ncbi:MAG TPA: AprI/Inh family metalloprotease inhibitor [Devosia sp.]|nr:AprI/Inh family metalloprotease inhibitor [Devosia sp.]
MAGAFALLSAPAFAQDFPEELYGMLGDWVIAQDDAEAPGCAVHLLESGAIGGYAIELPDPCPAPFPPADSLAAWNIDSSDGSVILLDAERHVVLRFFEEEDGLFATDPAATPPMLYLLPQMPEDEGEAE